MQVRKNLVAEFLFFSMEPLLIHLAYEVRVCGPPHYRWLYPFEIFIQYLKKKLSSRVYPEVYMTEKISIFFFLF